MRLLLVSIFAVACAGAQGRRPNVVLIYTDDQGAVDVGAYGAEDLATPALDRLAREGVRFTRMYAPAPVCSPSRAGLLTGRYPLRAGVPGNVPAGPVPGLPAAQVTIAETFRAAGYATGHVGKWHLGFTPGTDPLGQGFIHSFGHMGGCIDNWSHFFYWSGANRHDLWRNREEVHAPGRFFPDLMVEEADRFITRHRSEPFFLYFAMNAPHYPYQATPEDLRRFAGLASPRNLYAAFVATLDARIGRLLDRLDVLKLAQDTIVVFQSDHGHSRELRAHGGGGSAGPYRGCKFSLFEGGIRVPSIVRWPGTLDADAVRTQTAHACDWLPTLAALCRIPLLDADVDGRDLGAVLRSAEASSPHEVLHWCGDGARPQWAVMRGDWKLVGNPQDPGGLPLDPERDGLFLSRLDLDPGETTNRAGDEPERVATLRAAHVAWRASVR